MLGSQTVTSRSASRMSETVSATGTEHLLTKLVEGADSPGIAPSCGSCDRVLDTRSNTTPSESSEKTRIRRPPPNAASARMGPACAGGSLIQDKHQIHQILCFIV